jgi:DNA-binding transcriptional LysR family regulator
MAKSLDWDSRIGRRVRLRDLHILFAVVQHGSMSKAGAHIGMSQSAVSQAIAALEHALDVPLLDRTPRGVALTMYGAALMRRGQAAFDELRSGVKDIESLTDPQAGEVRIGCNTTVAAGFLPLVIDRFSLAYPRVKLHVLETNLAVTGFSALDERTADVMLTLKPSEEELPDHLHTEVLFHERIGLAAAKRSRWGRRRRISLADLADAALIVPEADRPGTTALAAAFRAAGLPMPQAAVITFSVHVRNTLAVTGRFVAVLPVSILRFNPGLSALKELPLRLPLPPWPVVIVTVRNRTLSPAVERFIACAREVAQAMNVPSPSRGPGAVRTRRSEAQRSGK